MATRRNIIPGQTYAQIDSGFSQPSRWLVSRVYNDPWGVRHAEIVALPDQTRRKSIACATLLEARRYRLLEDAPAPRPGSEA